MKKHAAARLRALLAEPGALLIPGASDALSAKLIEAAGFPAIYITGAGVSAGLLAAPDIGLLSFSEMLDQVRHIANAVETPLIVDADTGYGNALNAIRTVREYEHIGVAAIQLEDQVLPKRCGHLDGKQVIPADEMVKKIAAVHEARRNPETIIIARTDARAVLGLDEAIARGNLYHRAGADVIFIEAPRGDDEVQRIAAEVDAPLLLNLGGGGLTPVHPIEELAALGFKIVIYPGDLQKAAIKAMQRVLNEMLTKGTTADIADQMVSFQERFDLLGYSKYEELAKRFT
jgi:2,3-dimethylmalate lyase